MAADTLPPSPALQTKQAKVELTMLEAAARCAEVARPPVPTAEYCLLTGYCVRWEGEKELPPLLWRLLKYLLSRERYPFHVDELEDELWLNQDRKPKTF